MRILITGICGFVGSALARAWLEAKDPPAIVGLDSLARHGSETNRRALAERGVRIVHGDLRNAADFETLPDVDFVIDAAAKPSVLAGVDGQTSSRQVVEHNLGGTINLLEFCRARRAGLILLSTSRVYSIPALAGITVRVATSAYAPVPSQVFPAGCSPAGVSEDFSTAPPLSLYGATKLASETLALEYGHVYGFPVWINRCGLLAGAGQFGQPEQGIIAYWIHAWQQRRPLTYIGFDGRGSQVRDALHPTDLLPVLQQQMEYAKEPPYRIFNLSGGAPSAFSLAELSAWCAERFGRHEVASEARTRPFDIPWLVLDSSRARKLWKFEPATTRPAIFQQIADFAVANPGWLDLSAPPPGGRP